MTKILIAEDDHTMVALLQTLLTMEGFDVVVVDVDEDIPADEALVDVDEPVDVHGRG